MANSVHTLPEELCIPDYDSIRGDDRVHIDAHVHVNGTCDYPFGLLYDDVDCSDNLAYPGTYRVHSVFQDDLFFFHNYVVHYHSGDDYFLVHW